MVGADLDAVCAIEQAVFAIPWSRRSFENEVRGDPAGLSWVVVEEGRVVGYLVSWHVADELHIGNVAVEPGRHGKGIATALLETALAAASARGIEFAVLEVRVSNARAIRLYERFGFEGVAIRKGYYADNGENALVMLKFVPEHGPGGAAAGGPEGA